MKILMIENHKGWGGGQEHLYDLTGELSKRGVTIDFVCAHGSPSAERMPDVAGKVFTLKRDGLNGLKSTLHLATILKKEKYDIINVNRGHDIIQVYIAYLLAFKGKRIGKLISSYHVPPSKKQPFLGKFDAIVCISNHIKDAVVSTNSSVSDKITVLHYGINPPKPALSIEEKIKTEKNPLFIKNITGKPIIGMVGAFWKNQQELIRMTPVLLKEFPDLIILLIGPTEFKNLVEPIQHMITEMKLDDHVIFTGKIPRDELYHVYEDLSLSVSTHRNEGFGLVHIESLAMGTPIVAYNCGGIKDILGAGEIGTAVDGSENEFARAIIDLLKNREKRKYFGENGKELVNNYFSIIKMGNRFHDFYKGVSDGELISSVNSTSLFKKGITTENRFKKKVKSLQIISKQGPYGAEHIFIDQLKALKKAGHETIVVTKGGEGWVSDQIRALNLRHIPLELGGIKDILYLRRIIKKERVDIIHSTLDRADASALFSSVLKKIPIVTTSMVPRSQFIFLFFDKILCLSTKQESILLNHKIGKNKISILYPYIDLEKFSKPSPDKIKQWITTLKADSFDIILAHVSVMIERKNHAASILITSELKKSGYNPLLIVIGGDLETDYHKNLLHEAERLNVKNNIFFTGWTNEVPELLNIAHFTLLPSRDEALGKVLLEGLACGNPIVVTRGEGGEDFLKMGADLGIRYEVGNEAEVSQWIDSIWSSGRYRYISEKCRKIAFENFSGEKYVDKLLHIYSEALNN